MGLFRLRHRHGVASAGLLYCMLLCVVHCGTGHTGHEEPALAASLRSLRSEQNHSARAMSVFVAPSSRNDTSSSGEVGWRLLWLCPMPKPMPKVFRVDKAISFKNSYSVAVGPTVLGQTSRTFLSFTSEMGLRNSEGDLWGVARRPFLSRELTFYDCIGDRIVRLVGDWRWFGHVPSAEVLNADGDLVGRITKNQTFSRGDTTVVDIRSVQGIRAAQVVQTWTWKKVTTDFRLFLEPERLVGEEDGDNLRASPVNPLVDTRVLVLFAAVQFGGSVLFMGGFFIDLAVVLVLACVVGCCLRQLVCRRRGHEDKATVFLLERREEALKALSAIDDELERKRICGTSAWNMKCCSNPDRVRGSAYSVCPASPR